MRRCSAHPWAAARAAGNSRIAVLVGAADLALETEVRSRQRDDPAMRELVRSAAGARGRASNGAQRRGRNRRDDPRLRAALLGIGSLPGLIDRALPQLAGARTTQRNPTWLVEVSIGCGVARGRTIAPAIVGRAQVRAALDHLARNPDLRLAGVVALLLAPAARILRDAARPCRVGLVLGGEPVGGPFPDVADHVVEAVAVRRERASPARCARSRRGAVFSCGNPPCQVFAIWRPPGANSSPQANSAPSSPPRAANSHSASVGSSLPAQFA